MFFDVILVQCLFNDINLYEFYFSPYLVCGESEIYLDTDQTQQLASVNYPNNYINNVHCRWLIIASPLKRVKIEFLVFDFPTDRSDEDSLTIFDDNQNRVYYDEGYSVPSLDLVSFFDRLIVQFDTDNRRTSSGFALELSQTEEIGKF